MTITQQLKRIIRRLTPAEMAAAELADAVVAICAVGGLIVGLIVGVMK